MRPIKIIILFNKETKQPNDSWLIFQESPRANQDYMILIFGNSSFLVNFSWLLRIDVSNFDAKLSVFSFSLKGTI